MTRVSRCYLPDTPPRSVFELSHLYKVVAFQDEPRLINRKSVAMAYLVEKMWGLEMFKDESVRGSDWSKPCGLKQIEYAASDAYGGLMLFHELDKRRRACVPEVAMPAFAEFDRPLVEVERPSREKKTSITKDEAGEDGKDDLECLEDLAEAIDITSAVEVAAEHAAKPAASTKLGRESKKQSSKDDDVEGQEVPAEAADVLLAESDVEEPVVSTKSKRERKEQSPKKDERTPAEKAAALERRRAYLQARFSGKFKRH